MPQFRLTDPALEPIAVKVAAGERLSREDGIALFAHMTCSVSARWPTARTDV